jgi:hypothetical protein
MTNILGDDKKQPILALERLGGRSAAPKKRLATWFCGHDASLEVLYGFFMISTPTSTTLFEVLFSAQ